MFKIKDIYEWCKREIKKGNGNLKVQISSDEEGNSYHGLYNGLETLKDIDKDDRENRESIMQLMEDVDDRNWKEYAILG